jgi:hypothetical protein
MASPLQLLHGPTKLLVGSALSGLAADLALASSSPAFCYVHRPVYDEDTFKVSCNGASCSALARMPPPAPAEHINSRVSPRRACMDPQMSKWRRLCLIISNSLVQWALQQSTGSVPSAMLP